MYSTPKGWLKILACDHSIACEKAQEQYDSERPQENCRSEYQRISSILMIHHADTADKEDGNVKDLNGMIPGVGKGCKGSGY